MNKKDIEELKEIVAFAESIQLNPEHKKIVKGLVACMIETESITKIAEECFMAGYNEGATDFRGEDES